MRKALLSSLTALALLLSATTPSAARVRARQDEAANKLTPDEARDARELGLRFLERLRETDDIAPLVEELFVKDFDERLRLDDGDNLPMTFVRREVALQASPEELRRFYVAEFNFFSLTLEYFGVREKERRDAGLEDEEEDSIENMFPPDVVACLKDDPFFIATVAQEKEDRKRLEMTERAAQDTDVAGDASDTKGAGDANNTGDAGKATGQEKTTEQKDEDVVIKSLADLRAATDATEKAAKALRPYVPSLLKLREMQREWIDDKDFRELYDPDLETRDEVAYGLPAGTRFVRVNVEPVGDLQFYIVMVEEDGRLRILNAFPCLGD
jgi:hypothetical protein